MIKVKKIFQGILLILLLIAAFELGNLYTSGTLQASASAKPTVYKAPLPKTGQTTSYTIGDDGDLQMGVAWPVPRFIDNGDGTVTDNLTGLMWTRLQDFGQKSWNEAINYCNTLIFSGHDDWRLPNVKELQSLLDYETCGFPSDCPMYNYNAFYWTSTTDSYQGGAWVVGTGADMRILEYGKISLMYFRPVRSAVRRPSK